jgi:microcystin-dependent protein
MSDQCVGEIRIFAGDFAPVGWALCNGQLLAIQSYQALFALIGTTYGGDGVRTFALPNLQSQVPISQGAGPGLTPRTLGETGGAENVTLTMAQLPSHTHSLVGTTAAATTNVSTNNLYAATQAGYLHYLPAGASPAPTVVPMAAAIGNAGSNQPHPNIMPCVALTFIIALTGVYPSFS